MATHEVDRQAGWPTEATVADLHGAHPPGIVFHGLATVAALAYLWAFSVPGTMWEVWMGASAAAMVLVAIWLLMAVRYWWWHRRSNAAGRARWFLLAPLGGVLLGLLLGYDVSLRIRFAHARPAFERVAFATEPSSDLEESEAFGVPGRFGSYEISYAFVQGEAVIFYERNGAFINDAGFAYLPDGPFPELGDGGWEAPQFRHLMGPWYAWTASW